MREHRHFYVYEPKRRLISAPDFRDRVVHRAIYNIINPLFDKTFIYDSYACRKGKGTHAGADRAQSFIAKVENKHGRAYALKADVSRYFSSIDHLTLKTIIAKKIECQKTRDILFYIIDNSPNSDNGTGIPLGNLTSQIFANIYLHELDIFAKHTLKAKLYIRYMDDFIIIHHDKNQLHAYRKSIEGFLLSSLKLTTNSKTQIFPVSKKHGRALDFLGFRIYSSHRLLRKCSVNRIKSKLKKYRKQYACGDKSLDEIRPSIVSWLGHARHASVHNLTKKLLSEPFIRSEKNA